MRGNLYGQSKDIKLKFKYDDLMKRINKVKSIHMDLSEKELENLFPDYKKVNFLREMGVPDAQIKVTIDSLADGEDRPRESVAERNHRIVREEIQNHPENVRVFANAVLSIVQDALEEPSLEYKDAILVSLQDSIWGIQPRHGMI